MNCPGCHRQLDNLDYQYGCCGICGFPIRILYERIQAQKRVNLKHAVGLFFERLDYETKMCFV